MHPKFDHSDHGLSTKERDDHKIAYSVFSSRGYDIGIMWLENCVDSLDPEGNILSIAYPSIFTPEEKSLADMSLYVSL